MQLLGRLRGRKKADYQTIQKEAELAENWERSRDAGVYKRVFARDNGLTVQQLNALLDRVAKRKRPSEEQREKCHDIGELYIWTCVDQQTKLMPSFIIGKRSADNARRFMMDVAQRLTRPNPHTSDAHAYSMGGYRPIVQISTDGFAAYPEAVDLAFGPLAKYGTIIKEYRNANIIYTTSEMVGTKRTPIRGIERHNAKTITTSHVERLNGTQRLFMKRLNRLTYCFSKKLENLEAAFAMFAAYYNYCWQTRMPGKSGKQRPSAAMMAKIAGHVWSFDELFNTVLSAAEMDRPGQASDVDLTRIRTAVKDVLNL